MLEPQTAEALLAIEDLHTGYGATEILRGVDLDVRSGEIVTVLGAIAGVEVLDGEEGLSHAPFPPPCGLPRRGRDTPRSRAGRRRPRAARPAR